MKTLEKRETPEYLMKMLDSYLNDRILVYDTEDGRKEFRMTAGVPQSNTRAVLVLLKII